MPQVEQKGMLGHVAHGHSCVGHSSLRACKGSEAESRNNCGKQAWGEAALWACSCFSCGFTEEGLRVCRGVLGLRLAFHSKSWGTPEFKAGVDQESRTDRNLIRRNQQPESCEVNLTDTNASPLGTSHTPLSTLRAATIPKAIDLISSHKAINLVYQVARDGIRSGDRQSQILTTPTYTHTCTL